jgi:hypothetical protein
MRILLLRRSEKGRQRRLAFLYLVRVTEIIALKKSAEYALKDEISKIKSECKDDVGLFLSLYFMSSGIAKKPEEMTQFMEKPESKRLLNYLQSWTQKDEYLGYKFDDDLLSGLPNDSIVQYGFFIQAISEVKNAILTWLDCYNARDFSLLTADALHSQYRAFKNLLESADALRSSLIDYGKIREKIAYDILNDQYKRFVKQMVLAIGVKKLFENVSNELAKKKDELPAPSGGK